MKNANQYFVEVLVEGQIIVLEGDSEETPQASTLVDEYGYSSYDWKLV